MKIPLANTLFFLLLGAAPLSAVSTQTQDEEWGHIQDNRMIRIENRILAKPRGKAITVMDLAKRLDVHFHRAYPHYQRNLEARYQFYKEGWRQVLEEMINNELILADAEEKKVTISDGEIRRELEELFGPNVVASLDELNMSFEEAMAMVKTDMISDRMKGYMVTSRAMVSLSPEKIRLAYDQFQKGQGESDEWEYQVLSIRHKSASEAEAMGGQAALMVSEGKSFAEIKTALIDLREEGEIDAGVVVSLSDLEKRSDKTLALSHREVLSQLGDESYSPPQSQVSRVDGSTVMRLFYLKEHSVKHPPTFDEVQGELKNHLLQLAASEEQSRYIRRLRTQYGVTENSVKQHIPAGFEPFTLQGIPRV